MRCLIRLSKFAVWCLVAIVSTRAYRVIKGSKLFPILEEFTSKLFVEFDKDNYVRF